MCPDWTAADESVSDLGGTALAEGEFAGVQSYGANLPIPTRTVDPAGRPDDLRGTRDENSVDCGGGYQIGAELR